jgi:hypothetical protein
MHKYRTKRIKTNLTKEKEKKQEKSKENQGAPWPLHNTMKSIREKKTNLVVTVTLEQFDYYEFSYNLKRDSN